MNLGDRFRYYRLQAKLSQKEAAELIGIQSYKLANYETNRSEPSISVLIGMSQTYRVSIDLLVGNNRYGKIKKREPDDFEVQEFIQKLLADYKNRK